MEIVELSFYDWLLNFKDINLPIGDLARDVQADTNFPKKSKSKNVIIKYLENNGAIPRVIEVADETFDFYAKSHLLNQG